MKLKIKNRLVKSILIVMTILSIFYCLPSFIVSDCCSTELYLRQVNVTGHYKNNDLNLLVINEKKLIRKGSGLKASDKDLVKLFAILQRNNAILLDAEMLAEALNKTKFTKIKNKSAVNHIDKFSKLTNSVKSLISFGIYKELVDILQEDLRRHLNENFNFIQMEGEYHKIKVLTSLYVECENLVIHIAILYNRGNFLWIGGDDYVKNLKKIFGDVPRSINKYFKQSLLIDKNLNIFNVPADIRRFFYEYNHSVFIECNNELAEINQALRKLKNLENKRFKFEEVSSSMNYIAKYFELKYKHYWLSGGTLLGWYRDCGLISYSDDVDFNTWASDYDEGIRNFFLGNKRLHLWLELGKPAENLEFRLSSTDYNYDVFFTYKNPLNESVQWCSYQYKKSVYRRILPNFEKLCSGELMNNRYMVPCDPVNYLDIEYSKDIWRKPEKEDYDWPNLIYFNDYSDEEYKEVVKYYSIDGKFDANTTRIHLLEKNTE